MKSTSKRHINNAGFTLMELLVAIGVLSIAMVGIYNLFSKNAKAYVSQKTTLELTQELRGVLNLMTTEIRMAGYYTTSGNEFQDDETEENYDTDLDSIHFVMDLDEDNNTSEPGEDVNYFVNASGELIRRTYDASGMGTLQDEVAAENITDIAFKYYDADNTELDPDTMVFSDIRSVDVSLTGNTGMTDPLLNTVKSRTETARIRVRNMGI